jgi:hypothetical protein
MFLLEWGNSFLIVKINLSSVGLVKKRGESGVCTCRRVRLVRPAAHMMQTITIWLVHQSGAHGTKSRWSSGLRKDLCARSDRFLFNGICNTWDLRGERGPYYAPHCGWAWQIPQLVVRAAHTRNMERRAKNIRCMGPFFGQPVDPFWRGEQIRTNIGIFKNIIIHETRLLRCRVRFFHLKIDNKISEYFVETLLIF